MKKFFSVLLLLAMVQISFQKDPMDDLMEKLVHFLKQNPKLAAQLLKTHANQIIAYLRAIEKQEPYLKELTDILEDVFRYNFYLVAKICQIIYDNPFIMEKLEFQSYEELVKYLNKLMKTEFQSFLLEFVGKYPKFFDYMYNMIKSSSVPQAGELVQYLKNMSALKQFLKLFEYLDDKTKLKAVIAEIRASGKIPAFYDELLKMLEIM